jgi:hypothetical protein
MSERLAVREGAQQWVAHGLVAVFRVGVLCGEAVARVGVTAVDTWWSESLRVGDWVSIAGLGTLVVLDITPGESSQRGMVVFELTEHS